MSLDERTAIVTGGASGIGRALGARLADLGARVVLADVDGAGAEKAAREIADRFDGRRREDAIVGRALDVTDADAFASLVREVVERDGRIDLLVNNAGISMGGPTHELTAAHWDRIIDVNLRGVVHGVLAAYPTMIEQGHGRIVNVASGAGLAAPPFVAAYATTKSAVVGLTLALRPEAALHGVDVCVLCPGSIDTPILDRPPEAGLPAGASAPVSGREYLHVLRQRPAPVEPFAEQAVRGILGSQAVVCVPSSVKLLWYLQRLSPALVQRLLRPVARQVDRSLVRPAAATSTAPGSTDEQPGGGGDRPDPIG